MSLNRLPVVDPMFFEEETASAAAMMGSFNALLEQSFDKKPRQGQLVAGEILRFDPNGLLVDVGGKSEGLVPLKEIPDCNNTADLIEQYRIGQVLNLMVIREFEEGEIQFNLSIRRALSYQNWDVLEKLLAENAAVEATIASQTKGGVLAMVKDLRGFIPTSHLRLTQPVDTMIGQSITVKLLEVDKERGKLILSHRAAVLEQHAEERGKVLRLLNVGDVVTGPVVKLTEFGAFVDIHGMDGLLPLSEISWKRLGHPSQLIEIGQSLELQVLSVDEEQERISLSLKRMQADPWESVHEKYPLGSRWEATVSRELTTGMLVELEPGVEAFCHTRSLNEPLFVGQAYVFEVVSIASEERRMTLRFCP